MKRALDNLRSGRHGASSTIIGCMKSFALKLTAVYVAALAACAAVGRAQHSPENEKPASMAATQSVEPTSVEAQPMGPWGFDLAGMDASTKPGDDFAKYASGQWLATTRIPDDRSRYGGFDLLHDLSELRVRKLLEGLSQTATTLPSEADAEAADRVKLAGLFASYLDEAECERKDAAPIQPMLAAIKLIATPRDMAIFMGKAQGSLAGGDAVFAARVGADDKHPDYNTLIISQAGLGLPDRDYYLKPAYAKQKERYQQYVAQMLALIGWSDPTSSAEQIVAFESKLAEVYWSREQNRDRDKTYNPMTVAALAEMAPEFQWQDFLNAAGVGRTGQVIVSQVTAVPKIARIFGETPIATIQAWQAYSVVDEAAPLLSKRFVDASFDFHGRFMSGAPQQRSRVKRAVSFCETSMGEAIGREYVAKFFSPDAKAKAEKLVDNIHAAMRNRIDHVEWMSPQTKAKALAKIDKFHVKIGYPSKWRDYSMLIVDPDDLFGNAVRAQKFQHEYRVSKLGQKVDKLEWGMTPQTVNGSQNEIVFPAAIMQPPFFDPNADPAVNYGGIGAVIGHEITHGFDDQGRKSDGDGVLTDWWTVEDATKFGAQAAKLSAQYAAFEFPNLPGSHINGWMTMGENIADLGGVLNALDAYHLSLKGEPAPIIDHLTGDQRFFLGWAQVWRSLVRDEALKQELATDPHSPGSIRAFAPLRNVDAWYKAFDIQPTDKEYVAPEDRVRIW